MPVISQRAFIISEKSKTINIQDMKLIVNKCNLSIILSVIIYKIILDLTYYFLIPNIFEENGFVLNINNIKLLESYFFVLLIVLIIPKDNKKISTLILWVMTIISYIPMLTLWSMEDQSRLFMYEVTIFWLFVFILMRQTLRVKQVLIKKKQSNLILSGILIILSVSSVLLIIYSGIFSNFNFNLAKVYEIRARFIDAAIPFSGYIFNWMSYIINPVLFILFFKKKRWLLTVPVIIMQFILFSITGLKTYIFALPFALILYLIMSKKNPFKWLALGITSFVLLGVTSYYFIGDLWILDLSTRRTLFVPGQIYFYYYDFFSQNSPTFLSQHHFFSFISDYPYSLKPGNLIGQLYFGSPEANATTGVVGDAYMNFGFPWMLLWGGALALILKLVNMCARGLDIRIAAAAVGMISLILSESALLTTLLTHGLWLACLVLYLLPREETIQTIKG